MQLLSPLEQYRCIIRANRPESQLRKSSQNITTKTLSLQNARGQRLKVFKEERRVDRYGWINDGLSGSSVDWEACKFLGKCLGKSEKAIVADEFQFATDRLGPTLVTHKGPNGA